MDQQRLFNPQGSESSTPDSSNDTEIVLAFGDAVRRLDAHASSVARLQTLSRKLADPSTWTDPSKCKALVADLRERLRFEAPPAGWPEDLLERAETALRGMEQNILRNAVAELERRCAGENVPFQCVSRQDLEYRVGPMTAAFDPPAGACRVSYAREFVAATALDPDKIWKEIARGIQTLRDGYRDAGTFFEEILVAYKGLLGEAGLKFGDRIELADIPGRMSARRQPRKYWADPEGQRFRAVSRAMLAFGLDALIREKGLSQGGFRLRLGSATMDTTKKKIDVMYLEKGQSGGQFYLTLWFERTSETSS